jgi:hypothetical protein
MPSRPFQSFEASRGGNLRRTQIRAGKLSPIGDKPQHSHCNSTLFMLSRWTPAIPLATTDLSCGRSVKDLTSRRYSAEEMTTALLHTRDLWPGELFDLRQTVGCVHL